jgi:hypothetical protein
MPTLSEAAREKAWNISEVGPASLWGTNLLIMWPSQFPGHLVKPQPAFQARLHLSEHSRQFPIDSNTFEITILPEAPWFNEQRAD